VSFIKKFFQKIAETVKNIFREPEVKKITVTAEKIPKEKVKAEVTYKPVKVYKPKPTVQPQILGYRCTLALNYVVHHVYYSKKVTMYTRDISKWEELKDEFTYSTSLRKCPV